MERQLFDHNRIKYLFIISTVSAALLLSPVVAFAQTATPTRGAKREAAQDAAMNRLKTRATNEIDRRVTALNAAITRINGAKRLTADQKSNLVGQVQQEITTLTTLKTKIDGDTDLATLRTDVQSIILANRVYLLFIPKMEIIGHADQVIDVANELSSMSSQLQSLIDTAKNGGKDVTQAVDMMTDRSNKLNDATTQAENATNAVIALTPEGYPGNKTSLTSARDMLKTARQDLRTALQDGQKVRQILRSLGVKSATPTPTP